MWKAVVPAIVLVLLAGLGCDLFRLPTNGNGGIGEWKEPTNPRAVIENIEFCYNNVNYELYTILLDEENFVFYFDPEDVGGEHDIPPSWTYEDEIEATRNLFEAVGLGNIDLVLVFDEEQNYDPGPDDLEFDINNVAYELVVYDADADQGPMTYKAKAHASFKLSKFQDDKGLVRWWLTLWWDIVA
jgi:hypothetical protein